ncbi:MULTISPECIES: p-aminobenzoyl-glutamate transporter [Rahnella]|jgi:aminobenzoyl-glutamate transport protein|uniref:p-aminobenzoyl-glutamate transporter n=1 Tax=Rahnella laticis TaxID=2787622 RepID=A0ABS0E3U3_9GAMM|nr:MULTISPECIES: p-aminobenzoyl-glutamate transporter [Rahnella]MBF7979765.1 p-aminobenzoyl-glutamate transporter [Rahnella laticis]MBF7999855.1 p-aminobenzoyl-glutamate transporter [Rahnella sp. LAC-M12]MCS3422027.1 aminobenzoyl-glutamate transport protein [Rahnella sp. BIGb0603]PKE30468.1 p-aminobenzoyl-glutamate transporter [Rahnella sp. AA]
MSIEAQDSGQSPGGFLQWVERVGNKIPNPFLLFVYLIAILMVASAVISWLNITAVNPSNGEVIHVKNLLSVEGIQWILPNVIKNFSGFTPLGSILALVIGAGLAERVGLLQSLMYKMASKVNARYASYMVIFIAFFSHISSDAALVVMPPLGALIFLAVGRHPVAGLLAAIAGVGCGFTANLLIVTTDVLLSGLSTEAAKAINPAVQVSVIDNWYFMAASVILLTIVGAILTDKFVEPRLPVYRGERNEEMKKLTPEQNRGLMASGIAALVFIGLVALLVVPEAAPLRNPKTGGIIPSPFIQGIVPLIILFFFVISVPYGMVTKQIRSASDVPDLLVDPMKSMAGFIVMVFPLSQFVAFFNWSNMGKFMAIGLTDVLENLGMTGIPAFLGLIFLSALLCMFIASGSAIWSILAPIFVPMFMLLGFHPAFAQIVFRVADSSVIPLAPMSPFVPLFLGFLQRYNKEAKLGTYYSLVLPYPIVFFVVWLLMLVGWYLLGLPIGPGVYPHL